MAESPPARGLPGADRVPAPMLLISGIVSIQFGAAFATTLFDRLGPSGASVLRLISAALILAVLWRPTVRGLSGEQWRAVAGFGLVLGAMNLTFYESLDRIPIGTAVTIEFLGPLGLAVALSRRRADVAIAFLALAGVVLLTEPWGQGVDALGAALALFAGCLWATYVVLAQRASRHFDGSDGLTLAMAFAVLVPLVPGVVQAGDALLQPELIALGALVGIFSSVIPYSLETEALRRLSARVFSVLLSLEPALAALAGFIVLGQRLGIPQLAGIGMVVAASIGVTRTPTAEV